MNTNKLAHDLIVSANTAIYCYSHSPGNFAAALAALEESANAMNEAEAVQVEPVAVVVSSGPDANLPCLQWISADHSFRVAIGDKLFSTPQEPAVNAELLEIAGRLALATNEGDDSSQGTHYVDSSGRIRCKGSFLALIEDARAAIAKASGAA